MLLGLEGGDMRFGLMVAAVLFVSPALAGDEDVAVLGAGQRSCGQFIAAVGNAPVGSVRQFKNSSNEQYFGELIRFHEWMMGFVTGYNALYAEDFNSQIRTDLSAMDLWMRKWCNDHPTSYFFQATLAFRNEMVRKQ
jgi:hypothetical protein